MTVHEGFVTTADGVRLFFRKFGTAPSTVLIPNGVYIVDDFAPLATTRTLVFFDVRNRGRSDAVTDPAKIERGVLQDVDDIDAIRRHLGVDRVQLIGHSYVGIMVALYAMKYPAHTDRVVQIGSAQPHAGRQYPPDLMCVDETFRAVMANIAALEKERASTDPVAFCEKFWTVLDPLYVTDPADVGKLAAWHRCDLPNERGLMKYLTGTIMPSIQRLNLTADEFAKAQAPILTIHGTRDRSAPLGGGRDWAAELPNARLLAVKDAGHAPWIESPALVFEAIETFLNGRWPAGAERIAAAEVRPT